MSNPSQVIALVEDEHHRMLVYRYLTARRRKPHTVRIQEPPPGRDSAEHWVLEMFPAETRAYRERQTRAESALIVMIDADNHSVQHRLLQLDRALKDSHEPALGRTEKIARLVPKRNVETWILCLTNVRDLNENANYKRERRNWHDLIPPAAATLFRWTQSPVEVPAGCLRSLRTGLQELRRLRF